MANRIDFNINLLVIMIALRAPNGCHNLPKYGSWYISALKTFVQFMPTLSGRG